MKAALFVLAFAFIMPKAHADLYSDRAEAASQAAYAEAGRLEDQNAQMIEDYQHAKIARFGAKHGGATITDEHRLDFDDNAISESHFNTGDGLACSTDGGERLVQCLDANGRGVSAFDSAEPVPYFFGDMPSFAYWLSKKQGHAAPAARRHAKKK